MVDFAFVFDQDGTLVRNRAFKYAYEKLPKVLGLDEERDVFPKIFLDTYYELVRARRFTDAFDWEKVSEFSCRRIGITYRRGLFLELILEGINKCLVDTNECAADVLRTIKKSGGAIYVLTNGYYRYQFPVLRKVGIAGLIDELITNDRMEEPKPSRKAFEKIFSISGLPADKIYFVGDHPYFDVYGALNAGIKNLYWITDMFNRGVYLVKDLAPHITSYVWNKYRIRLDMTRFYDTNIYVINKLCELLAHVEKLQ